MNKEIPLSSYFHFDKALCSGCLKCVKICPTKAIRLRHNHALQIVDHCIGCWECVRVCPTGAISAATSELKSLKKDKVSVVLVRPTLYAQFPTAMPADVLSGLRQIGFQHAMDMLDYIEIFQCATEAFIMKNRDTRQAPWPLISPYCPVVIHLIAVKFPSLLDHVLPILRPVELMAREVKQGIVKEKGVKEEDVVLYHITPNRCSHPLVSSHVDKVLGINDVYAQLAQKIEQIYKADQIPVPWNTSDSFSVGNSLRWAVSGEEIVSIDIDRSLAVSGLREVISYLEKIEMGLFSDVEYIEFRSCSEGCIGGALTAIDKYVAKSAIQKMIRKFNPKRRLPREKILRLYEKGRFKSEINPSKLAGLFDTPNEPLSIESLQEIDMLLERINGKDCGACGAPDCRTFAEDVVRGRASQKDCFLIGARGKS